MHYEYQIILKRWLPILKEYEQTKSKDRKRDRKRGRFYFIDKREKK